MFKGFTEFASLLKDAHRIPELMGKAKDRLEREVVTAESGSGAVTISLNGLGDVKDVRIVPALLVGGDPRPLEGLVQEAMELAKRRVMARMAEVVQRVMEEAGIKSPAVQSVLAELSSHARLPGVRS